MIGFKCVTCTSVDGETGARPLKYQLYVTQSQEKYEDVCKKKKKASGAERSHDLRFLTVIVLT